jgi:hypothetical protein
MKPIHQPMKVSKMFHEVKLISNKSKDVVVVIELEIMKNYRIILSVRPCPFLV